MAGETDRGGEMDNWVGPVIRAGDFADVVVRSIEDDNPGKEVRIIGATGNLIRTLTAAASVESAANGVRSFVPKWRPIGRSKMT